MLIVVTMAKEQKSKVNYKINKMAFKQPGVPMVDTSKKHGTNPNYGKSGVKDASGKEIKGGPQFGLRNILDPAGIFGKGKGKGNCPPVPGQPPMTPPPSAPVEPTTATTTPPPAAAAPPPVEEQVAP